MILSSGLFTYRRKNKSALHAVREKEIRPSRREKILKKNLQLTFSRIYFFFTFSENPEDVDDTIFRINYPITSVKKKINPPFTPWEKKNLSSLFTDLLFFFTENPEDVDDTIFRINYFK